MTARTAGRGEACHEMPMCEPGVTNTETSQDNLSVSGPVDGGTPSVDGGLNQGSLFMAARQVSRRSRVTEG